MKWNYKKEPEPKQVPFLFVKIAQTTSTEVLQSKAQNNEFVPYFDKNQEYV